MQDQKQVLQVREKPPVPIMEFTGFGKAYVPDQKLWEVYTMNLGLLRGTIFPELYSPYTPRWGVCVENQSVRPVDYKYGLLRTLSEVDFFLADLNLYLNSNPHDKEALALRDKVAKDSQELRCAYEISFGQLRACSTASSQKDGWQWVNDPWPWELEANFEI